MIQSLLYFVLGPIVAFACYVLLFWRNEEVTEGLVKRPPGIPFIGHIQYLSSDNLIPAFRGLQKYSPVVEMFIFRSRYLFLYDIGSIKEVLMKRPKYFRRERLLETAFDEMSLNPHSVFIAEGQRWKELRRLLLSPFSKSNVDNMIPLISKEIDLLLERLHQKSDESVTVDAGKIMMKYTLGVIVRTSLGQVDIDDGDNRHGEDYILTDTSILFEFFQQRVVFPGPGWLFHILFHKLCKEAHEANQRLDEMVNKILHTEQDRRQKQGNDEHGRDELDDDKDNSCCKPFIKLLLDVDEGGKLTDGEVVANIKTFMLAGSETTSVSLSWCLYHLALNPKYLKLLREEADRNFTNKEDRNPNAYPLCAAVFKEVNRLIGPAGFLGACLVSDTEPYRLVNGVIVKPYDTILLMIEMLGKDSELFPQPEEFNPLRWFDEDSQGRPCIYNNNNNSNNNNATRIAAASSTDKTGTSPTTTTTAAVAAAPIADSDVEESKKLFALKLKKMNEVLYNFGGGTRLCPGMYLAKIESLFALAEIVRNFDFELQCKPEEVKRIVSFTFKADQMPMKFTKRQ